MVDRGGVHGFLGAAEGVILLDAGDALGVGLEETVGFFEERDFELGLCGGGCSEDCGRGGVHEAGATELTGTEGDVVGYPVEDPFGGRGRVSPLRTRRRIVEKLARALEQKRWRRMRGGPSLGTCGLAC